MKDKTGKNVSDRELSKMINKIIRDMIIETAHKGAPVYSLAETLALQSENQLRKFIKPFKFKGYTKMDKPALVAAVSLLLMDPEFLMTSLRFSDEAAWAFFAEVAAHRSLQTDKALPEVYMPFQSYGLLQSYYHEDKIYFVVPREIRKIYDEIMKTDFPQRKEQALLIDQYAAAAVSLYGVIQIADLTEIINSQNDLNIPVSVVEDDLSYSARESSGYVIWQDFVVEAGFIEDGIEEVFRRMKNAARYPRYLPEREEFLRYGDFDYYETTPQTRAMERRLAQWFDDPDQVTDIMDELHGMCLGEVRPQVFFDYMDEMNVSFKSEVDAVSLLQLFFDMNNNTRLWRLNGRTPAELSPPKTGKVLPFPGAPAPTAVLTGRNDPCPCGSGKKYKVCCGKS